MQNPLNALTNIQANSSPWEALFLTTRPPLGSFSHRFSQASGNREIHMKPVIIAVAITGSVPRKVNNPTLPISPAEQIESTHAAFEAGARWCTSMCEIQMKPRHRIPNCSRRCRQAWQSTAQG